MTKTKTYKCVNCGEPVEELYRQYSVTVLKLSKCNTCKSIVDKYIEYDPVIVMIDLVLMSKEAQRHVIYNTDFKSYWKLFIILVILETYGLWRNDSLFNIIVNLVCGMQNNGTVNYTQIRIPMNISLPQPWVDLCSGWIQEERGDDDNENLFIWEKDFYIQFLSTFSGILMFVLSIHSLMQLTESFLSRCEVSISEMLKAFSLANMSMVFTLPMLVWGNADTSPLTRTLHYALVFLYTFVVFANVFTVLYERPAIITVVILAVSSCIKNMTTFHMTPYIKEYM